MSRAFIAATFAVCLLTSAVLADEKSPDAEATKFNAGTLSGIKLRNIGPAIMSGRIADIAIDTERPNTWYVAAGSGGLWKTTNGGTTWSPIFDDYGSYSIGCVTIDPSDRHTIWVGTGENVGGRHVGFGDGVYRSLDGGQSFKNMGLTATEHIGKILVDPRDSDVVYVAAQGPLWSAGGERGLYKTTDGGVTWKQILAAGEYTGVTDVSFDPRNPDVLYGVTHQRHRTVWALINGGPETGIFKSVDAGENWVELKKGLPGGDMGKISIAVSPQKPDVVYATIELAGHSPTQPRLRKGGFWRSANGGASWSKMSDFLSGGTGPHYYQEIFCDPHRFDVVYQMNFVTSRTEDGGKTWVPVENDRKHPDEHAIAFHPTDPDFLLMGTDGGLYRSFDRGKTVSYFENLSLTQFYKLSLDNEYPFYNIVGGTQDNSTQYGPSRTNNTAGIRNGDWKIIIGGDGHDNAIDPEDPNTIYGESQKGELRRVDRQLGQNVDIQPQPEAGEDGLRFNWDSPILISPHSHTRIYFGSKKLHRSDDRGDSWSTISPDLSRGLERLKLKVMDRVWSIDAVYDLLAMSNYGNITSISESPLEEGLIYVGTDDGLIQVTEDGGETWRKTDQFFGIPEFAFVNDVKADLHDVDTVYAAFDDHKTGDFKPYLAKSTDRGKTWTSIVGDLPDRHLVWRIEQDHVDEDLFFTGTEFGIFFSNDGGDHWIKLTGDVPMISFRDLAIQRRENDLVGASFGRGFFVLDDYSALREISSESLDDNEFLLFPVRKTPLYIPASVLGRDAGFSGDGFYSAPNPPFGAVFTYYLRDSLKTLKDVRHEQEAKVKEREGDVTPPEWDAVKREDREEDPTITFTIRDADGNLVNHVEGSVSEGIHRIAWNLRYPGFTAPRPGAQGRGGRGGRGPLVAPGSYTVSAAKRVDDVMTPLGEAQEFEVVAIGNPSLPVPDQNDILAFQMSVGELQRAASGAVGRASEALEQLAAIKQAVKRTRTVDLDVMDDARALERKLTDAREALTGGSTKTARGEMAPSSVMQRIGHAMSGSLGSVYGPTQTHRREYELGLEEYNEVVGTLRTLIDEDLAELEQRLDEAGVPWTPGRRIPELEASPED